MALDVHGDGGQANQPYIRNWQQPARTANRQRERRHPPLPRHAGRRAHVAPVRAHGGDLPQLAETQTGAEVLQR